MVDGYDGICSACLCPIKTGEGVKLRPKGRNFHKDCVEKYPDRYYVKIEKRLAARVK